MDQASNLREIVKEREVVNKEKTNLNARIITVTSGKGGVGKTSLTVNIAASIARQGKKVLVIDADLGLSNVEIMLGVTPSYTIKDLIKNNKDIDDILIKGPFNIDFISGGNGFLELTELSDVEREEILVKLKKIDELYDIILIDTGAGISKNVITFLTVADEILVITTSEPTALTDAYSIIKIVKEKKENPNISIIVNRVKDTIEYKEASSILVSTAKRFLNLNLTSLGFILEDKVVKDAVFKKTPFVIYYPDSKAALCIKYILGKISLEEVSGKKGIIEKFKGLFNK